MPQKRHFRKGGCRFSGSCAEGDAVFQGLSPSAEPGAVALGSRARSWLRSSLTARVVTPQSGREVT